MQHLQTLGVLADRLRAGSGIVIHSACSEPARLASMLAAEADAFKGAFVYSLMPMGQAPYGEAPACDALQITTFFPGKGLRAAVNAGRASILRHPLSAIPGLFDRRQIRADVVLLQVAPPDERGRISLGLAVDYMHAVLRQRPIVVAEINPKLPRTCGDSFIDTDCIDYFVEAEHEPQSVPLAAADDVDTRIAAHVASLVPDGAVLQVGIGSLPDLVLARLSDRKHLGVHTGIITEAFRPLLESGVVDNSRKQQCRGASVTTMAAGTQSFYDFLHRNCTIEFHPCSLTHDEDVLARIEGLTAINSGLQIDLSGRVNAEAVAGRIVAAPGGLPDFARGARRAPGGRSILAVRSSFKASSNVVGRLSADAPVTVAADDIDYVVTEHGTAALRNCSPVERAEALIAIADPLHHSALQRELSTWSPK